MEIYVSHVGGNIVVKDTTGQISIQGSGGIADPGTVLGSIAIKNNASKPEAGVFVYALTVGGNVEIRHNELGGECVGADANSLTVAGNVIVSDNVLSGRDVTYCLEVFTYGKRSVRCRLGE